MWTNSTDYYSNRWSWLNMLGLVFFSQTSEANSLRLTVNCNVEPLDMTSIDVTNKQHLTPPKACDYDLILSTTYKYFTCQSASSFHTDPSKSDKENKSCLGKMNRWCKSIKHNHVLQIPLRSFQTLALAKA